jgi:MFS family permease
MKKGSTYFLRVTIFVLAAAVLALCIFGLPAGITSDRVGYYRPILIGMYFPAIPFFIALYQALKLLTLIDKNNAFSELAVKALKNIKYCAVVISALYVLGMPYIYYAADRDDAPGVLAIGLVIAGSSLVIAVFAAVLEKLLQNVVDIKRENELTV